MAELEWDKRKATWNRQKHGVDFADAALALEDPLALTVEDLSASGEVRLVCLGQDPSGTLLIVVYTWREKRIRLISARKATKKERRRYEDTP